MLEHWVASREDWFFAWSQILMRCDHATGEVNLTEISKISSMSRDGWKHFVKRLVTDEMLTDVRLERRGEAGNYSFAVVKNWAKYQAKSERKTTPNRTPNQRPTNAQPKPNKYRGL